jgi:hypothetical protein
MRNLLILLAISVCLLSLGCSSNDESVYFTPVTTATIAAYGKVSFPVKNKLDAIILARKLIQTSRFVSIGEPQIGCLKMQWFGLLSSKESGNLHFPYPTPRE